MGLGLGLGLSFMGGDGAGGGAFSPMSRGASLRAWYRADLGITITMGAVVATGTAPPAVTLTGTPADVLSIEIDISTIGARGVALFQWKLGGVIQQVGQMTAPTFTLGTTGLTANFPVGAYVNDNVYVSSPFVSSWADQSGNGFTALQAAAGSQPLYVASDPLMGGQQSLNFTGSQVILTAPGAAILTAQPCTIYMCLFATNTGTTANMMDGQNSRIIIAYTNAPIWQLQALTTLASADAGAGLSALCAVCNGVSSSLYRQSSSIAIVSGDAGTNVLTGLRLGNGGAPNGPTSLSEAVYIAGGDTAPQRAQMFAYFKQRYGGAFV